jgi:sugar/nucleoside kinase (ribokinase family)
VPAVEPEIASVGEAFEDLVFQGLDRMPVAGEEARARALERTIGGGTVITAVAAARLGVRVMVASALPPGAARALACEGVRTRDLRRPASRMP